MDRAVTIPPRNLGWASSPTLFSTFALGLLLPVIYIPSVTGAVIPSGWVFLSIALPFFLWNRADWTIGHTLGLAFITFACASLAWSQSKLSGIETIWHWGVLAMAFCVGTRQESLRQFWMGLGIGMWINALVALAQIAGIPTIPHVAVWPSAAGLFFNPNMLSEAAAIILVGLLVERLYWLAPGAAICLAAGQGRTAVVAFFAVACGLLIPIRGAKIITGAVGLILLSLLFLIKDQFTALTVRTDIWSAALPFLTPFGNGIGSLLLETKYGMVEHLHNDLLELAFEFGVGGAPLVALVALAAYRDPTARPVLACAMVVGLASFALFLPVTGAVVAIVAGYAYSRVRLDGPYSIYWGLDVSARMDRS